MSKFQPGDRIFYPAHASNYIVVVAGADAAADIVGLNPHTNRYSFLREENCQPVPSYQYANIWSSGGAGLWCDRLVALNMAAGVNRRLGMLRRNGDIIELVDPNTGEPA